MTNVELIKALRNCGSTRRNCGSCFYKNHPVCHFQMAIDAADALEADEQRIAELEAQLPKVGEWVEDTTTYAGPGLSNYRCSLCGKICGTWRRGLKPSELPNWCGNCGARMKGEQA